MHDSSSSAFPVLWVREQFPALVREAGGTGGFIFADNAAGSQIVRRALDEMREFLIERHALDGGQYTQSRAAEASIGELRAETARFLGATDASGVVFGLNATAVLRLLAVSIGEILKPGDEIIISGLEHEANVTPWLRLQRNGVKIKFWPPRGRDYRLQTGDLKALLSERTRLLALTAASNLLGTLTPVGEIAALAHDAGAIVVVDGVHYAQHGHAAVDNWNADFYVCSGYKAFGPHVALAYCRPSLQERIPTLNHYFVDGYKLEIGAQNYEGIAGMGGVYTYLKQLGEQCGLGTSTGYEQIFGVIRHYEMLLAERMLDGLEQIKDVTIYGVTDRDRLDQRVPTFSIRIDGMTPEETSKRLCARNIACRFGHNYAPRVADHLKVNRTGGVVRISLCHYNTFEEVDRILAVIEDIRP